MRPSIFRFWLSAIVILATLPAWAGGGHSNHATADKTGQFSTSPGLHLHVAADQGDIRILTGDASQVSYHVHLETDADDSGAQEILNAFVLEARNEGDGVALIGRSPHLRWGHHLSVMIEVTVPRNYNLELATDGGNIQVADVQGRVSAATDGGNISAGEIGGPARLVTDGGHIVAKNVGGDLTAQTGGGDITVGSVTGGAVLRTGGGHIRVASIAGAGRLDTGGGNISIEHAGAGLVVSTGGGEIEVGEASGLIRARTGGGGIRVVRSSGPTELETGAGSVYLMQVQNAVRASTGAGGITAWFGPDAKLSSACRLAAGEGDIVVYLPKELAITVDAQVEMGGDHRVVVDPAFPLKVTYGEPDEGSQVVRAEGALNGGGETLVLRTVSGNIRLMLNDAAHEKEQMDQLRQQMEEMQKQLELNLSKIQIPQPPDQQ
jgi:Putative adhesin